VTSKFSGTERYVATDDLMVAVNAAVTLARPLLVKGEPGTGKTQLAEEIAAALDKPLHRWHIKSTTKAQHGLYEYDAVSRLRDSQLGEAKVHDIGNYIVKGRLWEAFDSDVQTVLLIDEIDKADIEFPNDLLLELDRMEFFIHETRQLIKARHRPIVVITSNNEKELPDAFLRRCFFHFIRFPDAETMTRIVAVHFPDLKRELLAEALNAFYRVREVPGLKKKTLDLGAPRLAQAPARRGRAGRGAARRRSAEEPAAAVRRAAEERAGRTPVRAGACSCSAASSAAEAMLNRFFFTLRDAGIPVTVTEYLALLAALDARVAVEDVDGFYYLARAALVKDEKHYDRYDRAFAAHFKGAEQVFAGLAAEIPADWLRKTLERVLTEEEKAKVEAPRGLGQADGNARRAPARTARPARRRQQVDRHGRDFALWPWRLQP
jgi:MoxR-like ATPase